MENAIAAVQQQQQSDVVDSDFNSMGQNVLQSKQTEQEPSCVDQTTQHVVVEPQNVCRLCLGHYNSYACHHPDLHKSSTLSQWDKSHQNQSLEHIVNMNNNHRNQAEECIEPDQDSNKNHLHRQQQHYMAEKSQPEFNVQFLTMENEFLSQVQTDFHSYSFFGNLGPNVVLTIQLGSNDNKQANQSGQKEHEVDMILDYKEPKNLNTSIHTEWSGNQNNEQPCNGNGGAFLLEMCCHCCTGRQIWVSQETLFRGGNTPLKQQALQMVHLRQEGLDIPDRSGVHHTIAQTYQSHGDNIAQANNHNNLPAKEGVFQDDLSMLSDQFENDYSESKQNQQDKQQQNVHDSFTLLFQQKQNSNIIIPNQQQSIPQVEQSRFSLQNQQALQKSTCKSAFSSKRKRTWADRANSGSNQKHFIEDFNQNDAGGGDFDLSLNTLGFQDQQEPTIVEKQLQSYSHGVQNNDRSQSGDSALSSNELTDIEDLGQINSQQWNPKQQIQQKAADNNIETQQKQVKQHSALSLSRSLFQISSSNQQSQNNNQNQNNLEIVELQSSSLKRQKKAGGENNNNNNNNNHQVVVLSHLQSQQIEDCAMDSNE